MSVKGSHMSDSFLPGFPPIIALKGEPIMVAPEFGLALAAIVIEWSRVEIGFDMDLNSLRQFPGIAELSPEMPRSFNKKVKLWRRSVKTIAPAIEAYQAYADHIRDSALKLALIRNLLVHGLWRIDGPEPDGKWPVQSQKQTADGFQLIKAAPNAADLEETLADIMKLAGDINGFHLSRMLHQQRGILKVNRG